ncbi:hypothetical protein Vretifemale_20775, partial [Volvox reticuliferus]
MVMEGRRTQVLISFGDTADRPATWRSASTLVRKSNRFQRRCMAHMTMLSGDGCWLTLVTEAAGKETQAAGDWCMAHTMMLSGATCRYGWEGDQAAGQSVPPPQGAAAMPCCWLQFCIATMLCSSRMLPNPRTRCCHTVSPACCIAASVAPATGAAGQAAEAAGQATERGSGAGDGRSRAGDEARRRKRGDGGDGSGVTEAQR